MFDSTSEIERQQAVVDEARKIAGEESEVYKEQLVKLNELVTQAGGSPAQKLIGKYAVVLGSFGQALSNLGGDAGEVGQAMLGFAQNLENVYKSFDKNTSKIENIASGISSLVGIVNTLISASEKRKQVEDEYYTSVISQQEKYNIALNNQTGLKSQANGSGLIRNYSAEIKDNYKKALDAQGKLQSALKQLATDGTAKDGLKTQYDGKTALQLIGGGAATGAAIGAAITGPLAPVGAAVGAVIGGIAGSLVSLFGGAKKTAAEYGNIIARYPDLITKGKDGVLSLNSALADSLLQGDLLDEKTKQLVQNAVDWEKQIDEARQAIKGVVDDLSDDIGNKLGNALVDAFIQGTDAATAFKGVLQDVLQSFATKILYTAVLAPYLKTFEDDVTAALTTNQGTITDAVANLYGHMNEIDTQINAGLQAIQDQGKAQGLDILKNNTSAGSASNNSLSGAIKGVTEETAGLLVSQISAIRITQSSIDINIKAQLFQLSGIKINTDPIPEYLPYLKSLPTIERYVKDNDDQIRRGLGLAPL